MGEALHRLRLDLRALRDHKDGQTSATKPPWLTYAKMLLFLPSVWFLIAFRLGQLTWPIKFLFYPDMLLIWRPVTVFTGIELYPQTVVGGGLVLPHFGQIFVNPESRIGSNVVIYNGVTIGCDFQDEGSPVIGDGVLIGAGAKIIGSIRVAGGTRVKANAVISRDSGFSKSAAARPS